MTRRGILSVLLIISISFLISACGNTEYIIKINNDIVTKQEFNLYLDKGKEYFEKQAGEDIWQTKIDGEDAGTVLKNSIVDTVIRTKIQANVAKQKNMKLTDEDKKSLDETVKKYMDNPETKDKVSKELLEKFVSDNMIAVKVFDSETKNIEITDQMFFDYLKSTGVNDSSTIAKEELEKMKNDFYESKKTEVFEQKVTEWKNDYKIELNTKELNKIIIGK